jgi:hypothetical protein
MVQMKNKRLIAVCFILSLLASCTPIATASVSTDETVLISYINYVDGGDELINCLEGYGQPNFIMYGNGRLVVYRNGQYWETILSQEEINSLLAQIENTGIMSLEKVEEEGFDKLILKGNVFRFSRYSFPNKSIEQTIGIINQFQPSNLKPYVPESLLLWVYPVESLTPFEEVLPKPIPESQAWSTKLESLSKIGVGCINLHGERLSGVMKQFNGFPDYQILALPFLTGKRVKSDQNM